MCTRWVLLSLVWLLAAGGVLGYAQTVVRVPEDYPTIDAAVSSAPSWAVIDISPGTYAVATPIRRPVTLRTRDGSTDNAVLQVQSTHSIIISAVGGSAGVTFERITIRGAAEGTALTLESQARLEMRDCLIVGVGSGVVGEDDCTLIIEECSIQAAITSVLLQDRADLLIRESQLTCGAQSNAIEIGGYGIARIEKCVLTGIEERDYYLHTRAVTCANYSTLHVLETTFLGWFTLGVIGHQAALVDVERCSITNCGEGIVLLDCAPSSTTGRILDNEIVGVDKGIVLYGRCSQVEISRNVIADTNGRAIAVVQSECGYQLDEPGKAFSGSITGEGNCFSGNAEPLCPAIGSGFWPSGFLKGACAEWRAACTQWLVATDEGFDLLFIDGVPGNDPQAGASYWFIGGESGARRVNESELTASNGLRYDYVAHPEAQAAGVDQKAAVRFEQPCDAHAYAGIEFSVRADRQTTVLVSVASQDLGLHLQLNPDDYKSCFLPCTFSVSQELRTYRVPFVAFTDQQWLLERFPDATPGVNAAGIWEVQFYPKCDACILDILAVAFYSP